MNYCDDITCLRLPLSRHGHVATIDFPLNLKCGKQASAFTDEAKESHT